MDRLRVPFLIVALVLAAVAVGVCLGSGLVAHAAPFTDRMNATLASPATGTLLAKAGISSDDARGALSNVNGTTNPPGLALHALALVAGLLVVVLVEAALPTLVGHRATAVVAGVVGVVVGILGIVGGLVLALLAVTALLLMVGMFLAAPFGTIAYLVIFGSFPVGRAAMLLSLLIVLWVAAYVLLLLAQPGFAKGKGMLLMFVSCLLLALATAFLQGFVPGILASITDAIAAVVVAVVAIIWSVVFLVLGGVSLVRALGGAQAAGGLSADISAEAAGGAEATSR